MHTDQNGRSLAGQQQLLQHVLLHSSGKLGAGAQAAHQQAHDAGRGAADDVAGFADVQALVAGAPQAAGFGGRDAGEFGGDRRHLSDRWGDALSSWGSQTIDGSAAGLLAQQASFMPADSTVAAAAAACAAAAAADAATELDAPMAGLQLDASLAGSWPGAAKHGAANDAALPFFQGRPIRTTSSGLSSMSGAGVARTGSFNGGHHPGSARSSMAGVAAEAFGAPDQLVFGGAGGYSSAPITPRTSSFGGLASDEDAAMGLPSMGGGVSRHGPSKLRLSSTDAASSNGGLDAFASGAPLGGGMSRADSFGAGGGLAHVAALQQHHHQQQQAAAAMQGVGGGQQLAMQQQAAAAAAMQQFMGSGGDCLQPHSGAGSPAPGAFGGGSPAGMLPSMMPPVAGAAAMMQQSHHGGPQDAAGLPPHAASMLMYFAQVGMMAHGMGAGGGGPHQGSGGSAGGPMMPPPPHAAQPHGHHHPHHPAAAAAMAAAAAAHGGFPPMMTPQQAAAAFGQWQAGGMPPAALANIAAAAAAAAAASASPGGGAHLDGADGRGGAGPRGHHHGHGNHHDGRGGGADRRLRGGERGHSRGGSGGRSGGRSGGGGDLDDALAGASALARADPLLEEFKTNRTRRWEMRDILGHVMEFSLDQLGSRFIQQKLDALTPEELDAAFAEIAPRAQLLMNDVFGNYVIQKFLELKHADGPRAEIASQMRGQVLPLSLQLYSCRVVQKALEVLPLDARVAVVRELDGHVMRCVRDQNGNHVVQKVVERVPTEHLGPLLDTFAGSLVSLSQHPFGCRVMQRILEHTTDAARLGAFLQEVLRATVQLAQDQYGNYVIQHIVERGPAAERDAVYSRLFPHIVVLSQNKFASNVVEKMLLHCAPEQRRAIVEAFLAPPPPAAADGTAAAAADGVTISATINGGVGGGGGGAIGPLEQMMQDQYGNYVVQKTLEVCDEGQRERLLGRVRAHYETLRASTFGKHIVNRLEKLLSAGMRISVSALAPPAQPPTPPAAASAAGEAPAASASSAASDAGDAAAAAAQTDAEAEAAAPEPAAEPAAPGAPSAAGAADEPSCPAADAAQA